MSVKRRPRRPFTVFDLIAPIYGRFYHFQRTRFRQALQKVATRVLDGDSMNARGGYATGGYTTGGYTTGGYATGGKMTASDAMADPLKEGNAVGHALDILDIGCGTGALSSAIQELGHHVTGVDPSRSMRDIAEGKPENKGIRFQDGNVLEGLPFPDKSFDICIASFVAHGLKPEERRKMYAEMGRIARRRIILVDYNQDRSWDTSFIEWLERGDYFNFIKVVRGELQETFGQVQAMDVEFRVAWYWCDL